MKRAVPFRAKTRRRETDVLRVAEETALDDERSVAVEKERVEGRATRGSAADGLAARGLAARPQGPATSALRTASANDCSVCGPRRRAASSPLRSYTSVYGTAPFQVLSTASMKRCRSVLFACQQTNGIFWNARNFCTSGVFFSESVDTRATATSLTGNPFAAATRAGISSRHGSHHVAQKFTSTTSPSSPRRRANDIAPASRASRARPRRAARG